jgi:hypothetical protein
MALEKRTIGRLPASRGLFSNSAIYYKYNIVTNGGSTFMSIFNDTISGAQYAPFVTYDNVHGYTIHIGSASGPDGSAYWQLMSYGEDAATIDQRIAAKADGDIDSIVDGVVPAIRAIEADDLSGESTDRIKSTYTGIIRTTAGDLSIKSTAGSARLASIKGMIDANANPFTGVTYRWNGFNEIHSGQVITGSISSGKIVAGSTKLYWFNVPRLECTGQNINNASENNGMLFTIKNGSSIFDAGTNNVKVYYSATKPAMNSSVALLTPTKPDGVYNRYICNEGYLVIEVVSPYTIAQVCAHIAWSGYRNLDWEAESNGTTVDFTTPRNAIHSGWMAGIYNTTQGRGVYDEIVFDADIPANRKWYRRVDRSALNNWVMDPDTTEGEGASAITYHNAHMTFASMKANGIYDNNIIARIAAISSDYLASVTDNTLAIKFTATKSVSDLNTEFGSLMFYFELATYASGSHNIVGTGDPNDFSTEEYVETNSLTITGQVITETSYIQGLKDYLRSLPVTLNNIPRVVAEHISSLHAEVDALNARFSEKYGDIKVNSIDQEYLPKFNGYECTVVATAAPTAAPDFIGQLWIDTTNKIAWLAVGMSAATDWKQIVNA